MKCASQNDCNSQRKKLQTRYGGTFLEAAKRSFRGYCENTGLHGFRYIVTSESILDKMVWCTVCTSAIIFCVMLMLRLWQHFSNNPTVTVVDTSNPIKGLHFPGITICNNNKVYKPHAEILAQKLLAYGFDMDMSNKLFVSLMKLIRPDRIEIDNATASWALDILGYSVEKLMLELMQPCNLLLVRCSWLGQIYDCSQIFKTVKSNEGFCCGFNYHFDLSLDYNHEDAWLMNISSTAEDLQEQEHSGFLPGVHDVLFAPGAGRDIGLAVALNIDSKNYKSSVRQFVGASVLVHDPLDYPDVGAQSASLQPGHVMSMALSGTRIQGSKELQNIPLRTRMCLFDGETQGERKYSYQTCISECLQHQIYDSCGCLPFFYPDEHPNERTCYLTDVDCILAHRRNLSHVEASHMNDCNCLPQCIDKFYELVAESIPADNIGYDSEITRGLNTENTSFLYAYFRDGTYLEYRKQTILGWDSLLASYGGIFGLCLGGSVISLVELLYYIMSDLFSVRKKDEGQRNYQNLPPASKLFVPVPVSPDLKQYDPSTVNKRRFLMRNQRNQVSQRNQKNSNNFDQNSYYE